MTPRARRAAAALAATAALTLTAACGTGGSGTKTTDTASCKHEIEKLFKDAATDPEAVENSEKPAACEGFTDTEFEKMTKEVMAKKIDDAFDEAAGDLPGAGAEDAAAQTELAVGDTYTYDDGLAVTIDSIDKLTQFGEYDDKPAADETGFRINITIENGTKKPFNLEETYLDVQGATNGGEVFMLYVEEGSKEMVGRLAPGVKTTKTAEFALGNEYGKTIVATFSRMDSGADMMASDPNWTGDIK